MSRVELAKIRSLTFYEDTPTTSRRSKPVPQLVCRGTPCKLYKPEVVRCVSLPGGVGTDVDWKCEADLPDTLRFGRVEVSCEGWSGPGDPYVLKGSCSLEYRLVSVPSALRDSTDSPLLRSLQSLDLSTVLFSVLWISVLLYIFYHLLLSCCTRQRTGSPRQSPPRPPSSWGGRGLGGWFPGGFDDRGHDSPPPPYSKRQTEPESRGWRPGFWTGAALGGAAAQLFNRRQTTPQTNSAPYDWERERVAPRTSSFGGGRRWSNMQNTQYEDRGEGTSNLGTMRRSTGLGGSSVR